MTIHEAISRVDGLKANTYTHAEKVGWLNELDGRVKAMVIDTHEGGEDVLFAGYDSRTSPGTALLVPDLFAGLYEWWLSAQIDYQNGEIARYNESITMFNTAWDSYVNWYNRNHMPVGEKFRFF